MSDFMPDDSTYVQVRQNDPPSNEVTVYMSRDPDGNEGVLATFVPNSGFHQLVAFGPRSKALFREYAKDLAEQARKAGVKRTIHAVTFTRTETEEQL